MGVNFEAKQREAREPSVEAPEPKKGYRARSASCVTPVTNCPFFQCQRMRGEVHSRPFKPGIG
jgi:hypothetical protein